MIEIFKVEPVFSFKIDRNCGGWFTCFMKNSHNKVVNYGFADTREGALTKATHDYILTKALAKILD